MHMTLLTAHSRLMTAALFGGRIAMFSASVVMTAIFWKSAARYFSALARYRPVIFADQLGAGIWLTAAGMVFAEAIRLLVTTVWQEDFLLSPAVTLAGLIIIMAGYGLHFFAWASVVHPGRRLSLFWIVGLVLIGLSGVMLALGLT